MATRNSKGQFVKGFIPVNKKQLDEKEVIELYKTGLSLAEISKRLGYKGTCSRIFKLIKSLGLSRPQLFQKGHLPYLDPSGEKAWNWKGGKKINSEGYREVLIGKNKYMLEHHMKWIVANQCFIPPGYVIHDINGIKTDNQLENLKLLTNPEHTKLHWQQGDIR